MISQDSVYEFEDYLFPYEEVNRGETIAIYGAGSVCLDYLSQLEINHYCTINHIYDLNKYGRIIYGIEILSPKDLKNEKNRIILAIADKEIASKAEQIIIDCGIPKCQIVHKINGVIREKIFKNPARRRAIYYDKKEAIESLGADYVEQLYEVRRKMQIYSISDDLIRIGAKMDGGYIMADRFDEKNSETKNKIAYSFGIGNEISWDICIASKGYDVYMYDHTIDGFETINPALHFRKIGIADSVYHDEMCETLENIMKSNGHETLNNMILKMDVEGAEYGFMQMVRKETLDKFDQIVFELHGLNSTQNRDKLISFLDKINRTHSLIHVHANNWADALIIDGKVFPDVIEVTYVKSEHFQVYLNNMIELPIPQDASNCKQLPDYILGNWNI